MELVELSKQAKRGFRIKSGRLIKYTNGRKRNHWINHYRHLSRKHLKDKCENRRCNTIHNLTIHHIIPLSSAKSEIELKKLCEAENCKTLCVKCHSELEQRIALERNNKSKFKKKDELGKKLSSLLVLEKGLWGEYRIVDF